MTWLQRYRARHYAANSVWLLPTLGVLAAVAAVQGLGRFDQAMGWESALQPGTVQSVLATMAASMFTFIVFISSSLLLVVQLASSSLTPRIIAIMFRSLATRLALTVFAFTFTFTLAALVRVSDRVPVLTTYMAAYGCLASLVMFLYLIDHVGRSLRPSGALWSVASSGRTVIEGVYPRLLDDAAKSAVAPVTALVGEPTRTVTCDRDGVVLAFDVAGLVALARRHDCVLELVPQVGDFVARGDPLVRVYQGGTALPAEALTHSVAVDQERTLEQDPAFAFRIIVDIASKALSPAINDPTTAVLALDQIHHLLRDLGRRHLDDERVRDAAGRLRLVYRTPDWEDFVQLAVTEIRHFGNASIQVARRLRAMLENLIQSLPAGRAALLRQELDLLNRSAERAFTEPADRALADVSDFQGVGGNQGARAGRAREAVAGP